MTLYEKGFVSMLEIASNPKENQGFFVLEFVAKRTLSALKIASKFYSLIPGYKKKESGEVLAPMLSQNPVYSTSNIRCLAWHPHCIKLAVAASDDSIRIYSENSQLIPLLKCRGQHLISSMAWRPLCASELAVGCELGVVIWHIDPNSVITRPSAANTQVLSRPNHTYVTSLAWSPHYYHICPPLQVTHDQSCDRYFTPRASSFSLVNSCSRLLKAKCCNPEKPAVTKISLNICSAMNSTRLTMVEVVAHELLTCVFNGAIMPGGEKEWGQSRAVPINPEHS
ncbi:hypothetical protein J6590_075529 [Homalodisca vitripennis]|nr:hypothetical protein J6590_075529 [Homalodisca vitripennis]